MFCVQKKVFSRAKKTESTESPKKNRHGENGVKNKSVKEQKKTCYFEEGLHRETKT